MFHIKHMKSLKSVMAISLLSIILNAPAQSRAQDIPCSEETQAFAELLRGCDLALSDCRASGAALDSINNKYVSLIEIQGKEITRLRESRDGLFNSPTFWLVVGALTTGTLVHLTK